MGRLQGKIAIVTGGASGIGRASAVRFAAEGATVVLADVQDGAGVVAEIAAGGGRGEFVRTDVARAESVQALIDGTVARHGRLDILFNNAGIGGPLAPCADYGEDDFDHVIAINLKGVFLGMKYGIAAMLKTGGGTIINTASAAGLIGARGFSAYAASKGGVIQLTRTAAIEYGDKNIRVNCICPGGVDTPILEMLPPGAKDFVSQWNPLRRLARPEEIAAMAVFLASDESSYATGAPFIVDGGSTAQ